MMPSTSTLTDCHRQWATRPADERFLSISDLREHVAHIADRSRGVVVPSRRLHIAPAADNRGLQVSGANGVPYAPTNWAFAQIATLANAPAGYLRGLPAPIAADCINWGLHRRDVEDVGVLITRTDAGDQLRAATGPRYGRIWNRDVADMLLNRFGDGISGEFRVPGVYGRALSEITSETTTLYAGDRDMFVFLADEERRIEIADRRGGQPGSLARGFMIQNSEVGSATLRIKTFLFDYVCSNRIVWGAERVQEISIRHTASAPDRWIDEAMPALQRYADATRDSAAGIITAISDARAHRLDDVDSFLARRYGPRSVPSLHALHTREEGRPIETRWDVIVARTALARSSAFQDERSAIEEDAGGLLTA